MLQYFPNHAAPSCLGAAFSRLVLSCLFYFIHFQFDCFFGPNYPRVSINMSLFAFMSKFARALCN